MNRSIHSLGRVFAPRRPDAFPFRNAGALPLPAAGRKTSTALPETVLSRRLALLFAGVVGTHGFAHAFAGMRAAQAASRWLEPGAGFASDEWLPVTMLLWATATATMLASALGAVGAEPFRRRWRQLALVGVGASVLLLAGFRPPTAAPGLLVDMMLLFAIASSWRYGVPVAARDASPSRRRALNALAIAAVSLTFLLILARPWHMRWGSTDAELHAALPGDELVPGPVTYAIQHAVTIDAPPEEIWPWLAQLGQDEGGFYSWSVLENLVGARITNAERIVPAWQSVQAGDSVFALPAGWLGIRGRLGWRVALAEAPRVLVLEKWGAFVLEPTPAGDTRLIVRTRGANPPRWRDVALAPIGLFVFEPAHFLMERAMLRGIRRRAEGQG